MNLMNATPEPFNAQRQAKIDNAEYKRDSRQPCAANSTIPLRLWHGIAVGLMRMGCGSQPLCFQPPNYIRSENNKKPPPPS